jgi:hypothetical protein
LAVVPSLGAEPVPEAFRAYENPVRCAGKLYNKTTPRPECKPADVKIEVAILLAEVCRPGAVAVVETLAPPRKELALEKLKELDQALAAVKSKIGPSPSSGSGSSTGPGARPPVPTVVTIKFVDNGSHGKHREQPTLYRWKDATEEHHYLGTGQGELVEIEPRLYRAFLQDRLGATRPQVRGDLPLETVRDDVQELLEKLRSADVAILNDFARRFPIQEAASMKRYLQATSEPADEAAQKKLEQMQATLDQTLIARLRKQQESMSLEPFESYDQKATRLAWLRDTKHKDPYLMRDLLREIDLDLEVQGADGKRFKVPVRSGKRIDVSDRDELRVDGVHFKTEQLKQLKLPEQQR